MDHGGGSALAYTVDSQGRVLSVREAPPSDRTTARSGEAAPPVALRSLVAPLTWEPVQRLLAWGAREGMTAAELLDTCRAATRPTTTRRQRSAR
jgi:hypothetical protein